MKRLNLVIILLGIFASFGCDEPKKNTSDSNKNDVSVGNYLNLHSQKENIGSSASEIKKSVLEDAQRNYQNAYNEYVRLLRESGPQTLDTLQALTIYQKNYQIYQMLLQAEKEKH